MAVAASFPYSDSNVAFGVLFVSLMGALAFFERCLRWGTSTKVLGRRLRGRNEDDSSWLLLEEEKGEEEDEGFKWVMFAPSTIRLLR